MSQAVVLVAGIVMGTCLAVSVLITGGVLLWVREAETAARWIGSGYYLLVGLMPVALWLAISISLRDADHAPAYATRLAALLTILQGALLGSMLGAGPIFLAVAINLPVMVTGFEVDSYGRALREAILWSPLSLVVGAAIAAALPLGLWAHHIGRGQEHD